MVKGTWQNQKELDHVNLEEILGESILWNKCPAPGHPISENMVNVESPAHPDCLRRHAGGGRSSSPALGLRENSPQILMLAASHILPGYKLPVLMGKWSNCSLSTYFYSYEFR